MKQDLVFVAGFGSSGTDLLKNIINAHPEVFLAGEFPFIPSLTRKYGGHVPGHHIKQLISDLKKADVYKNFCNHEIEFTNTQTLHSFSEIYSRMLSPLSVKWKGNKIGLHKVDKINLLFPDAKYIAIVRDVRDVALSWNTKWGKDKLLCASKWNSRIKKGLQVLQDLGSDRYLIVKYEDILDNLRSTVEKLCSFLTMDLHHNMLECHKHVGRIIEGKVNYGKDIIKDNKEKWRKQLSPREIRRIEEIAYDGLRLFDYSISAAKKSRPITSYEKYRGISREIVALAFVGNRAIHKNRFRHRTRTIIFEFKKLFKYG